MCTSGSAPAAAPSLIAWRREIVGTLIMVNPSYHRLLLVGDVSLPPTTCLERGCPDAVGLRTAWVPVCFLQGQSVMTDGASGHHRVAGAAVTSRSTKA